MCRSNKLQRRWRRPIKPGKVGGIDVCLAMPVPVPLLPRMFVCSHVCLCHADASNARVRLQQNTTRRSAPCHNLLQTVRYAACCTLHAARCAPILCDHTRSDIVVVSRTLRMC